MRAEARLITLDAEPEPVRIDTGRCAVLVVDMQNDFGVRGGMFDRAGIDIPPIERAVGPTARVLAAARAAGLPVVYLRIEHGPDLAGTGGPGSPHWIKHARLRVGREVPAPDGRAGRVLVRGTWNTDVPPRLAPREGDAVVPKHRYGGFFRTDLDRVLGSGA